MIIYLAGGESWANLLLDMGVRNQLFSYYYFRTSLRSTGHKTLALLARMKKAKAKGYRFMLDSGAFTYQVKSKHGNVPPPREYFEEYKDFIFKYHELFDIIAEFDVDGFVKVDSAGNAVADSAEGEFITTEQVDAWTDELLDHPDYGWKCMPVYHKERGIKWLQSWLIDTRSPYVAWSSAHTDNAAAIIALCHRFGKFIHGFGQTRIKTDAKYTHFDSVDSSTWLRADKYGGSMIYANDRLVVLDHLHKADRRIYKAWYESWGLDFTKIAKDDLNENRLATIITWRELSNSFERKAIIRNKGKLPYLLEMHMVGNVPKEHPLVTRHQAQKAQ